ncbi:heat shock [Moniliophthora roreri MCA 2997]|uniref:Heat shock n=2 Tax=Moniliophthora roreri TaxID=221103 RepID=V2XR52_MONRO|nr:heat shock [Moniliophthora roreri MCA 2997]KAI3607425.1 heat shock [Moniliophthora roreri]
MSPTLRKSGLQKEALALYRRALRMVRSKPPASRLKFSLFVRYTFRTNASNISPRDVSTIEHLLRKGKRQLEMYETPSVKDCWVSEEMRDWDRNWRRAIQNSESTKIPS